MIRGLQIQGCCLYHTYNRTAFYSLYMKLYTLTMLQNATHDGYAQTMLHMGTHGYTSSVEGSAPGIRAAPVKRMHASKQAVNALEVLAAGTQQAALLPRGARQNLSIWVPSLNHSRHEASTVQMPKAPTPRLQHPRAPPHPPPSFLAP